MRKLLAQGGESTCAHLAEVYGDIPHNYVPVGYQLGKMVHEKTNCPVHSISGEGEHWWPIPFMGRYITESGKKRFMWRLRDELRDALNESGIQPLYPANGSSDKKTDTEPLQNSRVDHPRNRILYGPPGTGKTYMTVVYAVAIIEGVSVLQIQSENHGTVLERFRQYRKEGLIELCTFHQSYSYEEFIEGIRPVLNDNEMNEREGAIRYTIQPGIFRTFCEKAESASVRAGISEKNSHDRRARVFIMDEINRGNIQRFSVN